MSFLIKYNYEQLKKDEKVNFHRPYQQCAISVMDTIADPDITFDNKGISNYYYEHLEKVKIYVKTGTEGEEYLSSKLSQIKNNGKNLKYDCITGVSGGVDSTYICYLAKKYGLRPLIVHFDNGWNSEKAVQNIQNIIKNTGFDLHTHVVDWNEFKDLQRSYFKANVIDIEALTDHAILATMYKLAHKNKIKYILSGSNIVTEGTLPKSWVFSKGDGVNIKDIHRNYGTIAINTFPLMNIYKQKLYSKLKLKSFAPINYLHYNKSEVKKVIKKELEWEDYGGKHFESIFTRFYQGYILPNKFNVDKRKAHLSDLIFSNQISKEDALKELNSPVYDENLQKEDFEFVIKKLNFSEEEFIDYINKPGVSHFNFKYQKAFFDMYPFLKLLKPFAKLFK
jgi:N-acetyl sugar amidotransferase